MKVQRISYEDYVAVIAVGGKAFSFFARTDTPEEQLNAHALRTISAGDFDKCPDPQYSSEFALSKERTQVCYAEVE